jgi:hypothetical protein
MKPLSRDTQRRRAALAQLLALIPHVQADVAKPGWRRDCEYSIRKAAR